MTCEQEKECITCETCSLAQKMHTYYNEWLSWDNEWHNELEKVYGRNASDFRYQSQYNAATERLAYLRNQVVAARNTYNNLLHALTVDQTQ